MPDVTKDQQIRDRDRIAADLKAAQKAAENAAAKATLDRQRQQRETATRFAENETERTDQQVANEQRLLAEQLEAAQASQNRDKGKTVPGIEETLNPTFREATENQRRQQGLGPVTPVPSVTTNNVPLSSQNTITQQPQNLVNAEIPADVQAYEISQEAQERIVQLRKQADAALERTSRENIQAQKAIADRLSETVQEVVEQDLQRTALAQGITATAIGTQTEQEQARLEQERQEQARALAKRIAAAEKAKLLIRERATQQLAEDLKRFNGENIERQANEQREQEALATNRPAANISDEAQRKISDAREQRHEQQQLKEHPDRIVNDHTDPRFDDPSGDLAKNNSDPNQDPKQYNPDYHRIAAFNQDGSAADDFTPIDVGGKGVSSVAHSMDGTQNSASPPPPVESVDRGGGQMNLQGGRAPIEPPGHRFEPIRRGEQNSNENV
ncbi:MAG TPA: hypothetical protein PKB15_05660 [Acidimicrobiia bacterium]|nr:hypothetical protein [Acidimicrobiia bacterium]